MLLTCTAGRVAGGATGALAEAAGGAGACEGARDGDAVGSGSAVACAAVADGGVAGATDEGAAVEGFSPHAASKNASPNIDVRKVFEAAMARMVSAHLTHVGVGGKNATCAAPRARRS